MPFIDVLRSFVYYPVGYWTQRFKKDEMGMICETHAWNSERFGCQPLLDGDVKLLDIDPRDTHLWCPRCAQKEGREKGHEYVVQKSDDGRTFEVLDLTVVGGHVVYISHDYDKCNLWIDKKV